MHNFSISYPNYPSFSLQKETIDAVIDFLKEYPDKREAITQKINVAILDALAQERYEINIQEYWKTRRT